ncbi:hypothetical protein AVEN_130588-1 [Araneus ventricosus]|uniref:Uncharacterized protein n=1 Tax=Araneus ventricosus TaxID=182803 RepID=A0A4Y2HIN8_ARAVE|nr:hypothetical protein AVEN_130588-1 [Araneus ventricosus]
MGPVKSYLVSKCPSVSVVQHHPPRPSLPYWVLDIKEPEGKLVWCGILERGCQLRRRPRHLTSVGFKMMRELISYRILLECRSSHHLLPAPHFCSSGFLSFEENSLQHEGMTFWDGPRHFRPRSNDEDDTSAGTPSPNFGTTPAGGRLAPTYDLMYTTDLQYNLVLNMEPSGYEAETLPPAHRGLKGTGGAYLVILNCGQMTRSTPKFILHAVFKN